jgi:hypothetical protein
VASPAPISSPPEATHIWSGLTIKQPTRSCGSMAAPQNDLQGNSQTSADSVARRHIHRLAPPFFSPAEQSPLAVLDFRPLGAAFDAARP